MADSNTVRTVSTDDTASASTAHKSDSISAWVIGILLGVFATLSQELLVNDAIRFNLRVPCYTVLYSLLGVAFIHFGRKLIAAFTGIVQGSGTLSNYLYRCKWFVTCYSFLANLISNHSRKGFVRRWLILWATWVPYIILLRPGIVWFDTVTQLLQMRGLPNNISTGQLTDHHPVFDSLIFYGFVELGNIFGSGNFGVLLYTIVQSLITTAVIAYILNLWKRAGGSNRVVVSMYVVFALFPFMPIFAIGMVKDSLFIPVFLLFITHFALTVFDKVPLTKRIIIALHIEAILMLLTKKTGLYIVVITAIIAVVVVHRKRLQIIMASVCASTIIVQLFLSAVLFPLLHIAPGGKQEMLVVPFMQASRVVATQPNVDTAYKHAVEDLLGDDVSQRYVLVNGDYIKGNSWDEHKQAKLGEFTHQWARGLLLYPKTYVEAWLGMESSWFTLPHNQIPQQWSNAYLMQVFAEGVTYDSSSQQFNEMSRAAELGLLNNDKRFARLMQDIILWINGTAIGSTLFSRALWTTWMMLLLLSMVFVRRITREDRKKYFIVIIPCIVSYLFLWVTSNSGSIEAMRYAMSVVVAYPVLLCLLSMIGNSILMNYHSAPQDKSGEYATAGTDE